MVDFRGMKEKPLKRCFTSPISHLTRLNLDVILTELMPLLGKKFPHLICFLFFFNFKRTPESSEEK